MSQPLVEVHDLKKYFKTPGGFLHAVDGVNLTINQGETLGIVGESGCGKSTLGRLILRLLEPTDGEILYKGQNIMKLNKSKMRHLRKQMQIIFQDPYASLNPRKSVSEIISEPLYVNSELKSKQDIDKRVRELMDVVGLAKRLAYTYPHELDGGRRQRIGIARALALNPEFIVCDEPVSALDVSIQAQILNLLMDLQRDMHLSYMFITHDLSVVKHISDSIAVMYLGQIVEKAPAKELFKDPIHPYTKALLNAIPRIDFSKDKPKRKIIHGEVTSPINPKPGCRFANRCDLANEQCMKTDFPLIEVKKDHFVTCTALNESGANAFYVNTKM